MKFSKNLSNLIEQTQPDWRDKFLTYKYLKKQLKQIHPTEQAFNVNNKRPMLSGDNDHEKGVITCFVSLLEEEIDKFNEFFMDKEEHYVIRLEVLQSRVAEHLDSDELMTIGREIVDFHGEMVLLLNYSALNYIGLVKILKKYDKRSGALVRLPFIKKVLQEPFFSTDIITNLVKECEKMLDRFFPKKEQHQAATGKEKRVSGTTHKGDFVEVPAELAEIKHVESQYMKQTMMALEILNKIRSRSSTVSVFSLPPM